MLDFFGKALEWLKSPKRWAAVLIICAALVFLPSRFMQKVRLAEIRTYYLPFISLLGLCSFAVLVVEFGAWLKTPLKSLREQRDRKAMLRSLTPPEMRIIAGYFVLNTDTQDFYITDGVVGGLVAKGLIYQSTTVSTSAVPKFAYNLQPWVRETLRNNPGILQAFMMIANRKPSVR
jgi:hypothetical protein